MGSGNLPRAKIYGDYNDENNLYVKMIPYCTEFLNEYANSSKPRVFHRIVEFALYCKNNLKKALLNINSKESLIYFTIQVNTKKIKKATKQHYYYFISHYFNFVKDWKKAFEEDDTFKNPIPSMKLCRFKGSSLTNYDLEMNYRGPDLRSIERILTHIYYVIEDFRIFPAISLMIYSGARIREICCIDIRLFILKERWFQTGVKSRLSERKGWYFFPKFFIPVIEEYLEKRDNNFPESTYLFPSKKSDHLSPRTLQYHLENAKKSLGLKIYTNSHAFRDFLNTKRADMGLSRDKRKFLLNQKAGDVNPESYMKKYKNRVNLRNLYDNFNPYQKLIKPDPKL